jgi:signal transduction histidine kinase
MIEKPTYKELMEKVDYLQNKVKMLEKQLTEKQEDTERLKTRFLKTVSHELRTPMNAILGFSNLMIDKSLPHEKKEEYMVHINQNSDNLMSIVDSMIDVSLLEAKELRLNKKDFNLHKLLQQVYHFFNIDKHKRGKDHLVLLLNKGSKDEDLIIHSDPNRLNQVLTCFLQNALKFTSRGLIEFGYKFQSEEEKIQFFVKDSGKGILYEKAQSIFDKFEKIDDLENNKEGVGLGLTLAKGLIELLGGDVWLETNRLNGTTFYFTIEYQKQNIENKDARVSLKEILI